MTPKKFIIACAAWFLCFLAMLGGIFIAAGVAALVGGADVMRAVAGSPPDMTRPAFWVCLILIVPCMLLGAAGGVAAIVLPVYFVFRIPMRRKGQPWGWLGAYIRAVESVLQDEW
jgi:hypothetical protein